MSPSLQERYLAAAARISALAVGDPAMRPGSDTYRVPQDLSQNQHVEGLPLGTVGGLRVRHMFPLDGEYDFQTKLYRTNLDIVRGLEYPSEFEVAIDGRAGAPRHDRRHRGSGGAVREAHRHRRRGRSADAGAGEGAGRAARGDRGVRRSHRGEGHGAAAAVPAQLRRQLRVGWPAAHSDAGGHRTVRPDGPRRHAEPARDLHLPAHGPRRPSAPARRRFSAGWRGAPIGSRSPPRSWRRSSSSTTPRAPAARSRPASSVACSASWPARASCSASSAIRPARLQAASTR